jgi:hypothetical protein
LAVSYTPVIDAAAKAVMECDEESAWDSIAAADCRNAAIAALRAALPWPEGERMPLVGPLMRELYPEKFR